MEKLIKLLKKPITSTIIAILAGFIVVSIILLLTGYSPVAAYLALVNGIFSKPKYITNVFIKSTPIILTGVSVSFAFKTGLFNIGAEGQYIMGTIAATMAGILLDLPAILQIPVIILSGVVAGALFGGIVGCLKAKFGIHEVITSIMLNWISLYLCNYIVNTKTFHQENSTSTHMIHESGFTTILYNWKTSENGMAYLNNHPLLKEVLLKTDLNIGFLIALVIVALVVLVLNHSTKGYELRAVGSNKDAAETAGISISKNIIHAMLISGAIAGLAGALSITGVAPHKISTMAAFENYGFNGLSVALIAGTSPIGCIFAGLLFGSLLYGGQSIQSDIGAPSEVINIMIGIIIFFVALSTIIPILADKLAKRGGKYVR